MADVTVSLATSGKDQVVGDLKTVESAGMKLGETFGSIAGKLAGLATAYVSVSGAVHAFNAVMDKGGQLADFSDQTGIAAGKLVVLGRAFENNGLHAEDLGTVINKMQKFLVEAGDSGSEAADKLHRLGLFSSDLLKLTPDEQFAKIAKTISEIPDPADRAATALEIFGKGGARLLALFADLPGAINQAEGEVGSFAETMETNARAFDSIGDGIGAISDKLIEFTAGLLGDSVPALQTFVDYFKSVDATEFGKGFSESLSRGIDIALSIFTNPGNLFLAFGESLILAFKTAINALDSGLVYAFEFAVNFFQSLAKDGIISYIGRGLEGAFALAVQGMLNLIASGIEGIAGLLPEKWAGPMRDAAASLRQDAEAAGQIFENNLAVNANGVANAFAEAQSKTELSKYDFMDAEGSSQRLHEYLDTAAQSGASVREQMQASVDHAREITAEANAWEKATNMLADNLSGATKSFKDFASGNSESAGLSEMSGLKIPSGDSGSVGPIATAADRKSAAASSRSARESVQSGHTMTEGQSLAEAMKDLLRPEDYMTGSNAANMTKASWSQLQAKMDQRANESVASDLSYYTGGDSRASKSQVINDLTSKYRSDGVSFGDARSKAEADFQSLVDQKMGGAGGVNSGGKGGSSASGKSGSASDPKADPIGTILEKIHTILNTQIAPALPIQVLA